VRAALAARGAGNECNLAVKLHCHSSSERSTDGDKGESEYPRMNRD
jgi:hypothetical protein